MRLSWDYLAKLIDLETSERDAYGNPIESEVATEVFCYVRSATRQERSNGGHLGYDAQLVIGIHPYEYANQELVELETERYHVMNTYMVDQEKLELTLGERLGDA